jgi:hypothetical protein
MSNFRVSNQRPYFDIQTAMILKLSSKGQKNKLFQKSSHKCVPSNLLIQNPELYTNVVSGKPHDYVLYLRPTIFNYPKI